jgi:hypothetical protein
MSFKPLAAANICPWKFAFCHNSDEQASCISGVVRASAGERQPEFPNEYYTREVMCLHLSK